jgi:hypothetical protein
MKLIQTNASKPAAWHGRITNSMDGNLVQALPDFVDPIQIAVHRDEQTSDFTTASDDPSKYSLHLMSPI